MSTGAGWLPDPTGKHQFRYHDGTAFTVHVSDNGVLGVDAEAMVDDSGRNEVNASVSPVAPPDDGVAMANWPAPAQPSPGYIPAAPTVSTSWPPPLAYSPPPQKRRNSLRIVTGVAVIEGLAIIALATALLTTNATTSQPIGSTVSPSGSFSQSMGTVVYSSNFKSNEPWGTGNVNANTTATLSNGQYLIHAWTYIHHLLFTPYSTSNPGISVEAAATGYPTDNISVGVGCQSGPGIQPPLVYQLAVYPGGQWYIEEGRIGGSVETLASGYTSPLGATATTQLTCVITDTASDRETTQLVAYVDGARVGAIGDQIVGQDLTGFFPILLVGTYGPTVQVTFTAITVRKIDPRSVDAVTLSS